MDPIICSQTYMCRICPNTFNLIDLNQPENDFILKDLETFVFVEMELSKQLPKYICIDCNTALNNAVQFKTKMSERFEEIRSLIEVSMKPIKSEIIYEIAEVLINPNIEEQIIKVEEPSEPKKPPRKRTKSKTYKKKNRTCIYCQKEIGSYKEMTEHNRTHTDCPLCPKKYASYGCFKVHYKNHHLNVPKKDEDQKYSCELCGKEFKRKKNIVVHIRSFHNKERNYVCEICNKSFYERTALETHKSVHSDERPFVCDICKRDFKTHNALRFHKETHNEDTTTRSTNNRLYICTFCGKQSRGLNAFQIHQRIHTNEFPYDCKLCNKKFRSRTNLTCHKRIHTGEKPYKCILCPKRFRMYHFLANHKLSHGGNNVEKFSCNLCGMSTVYKENLDTHMKTVHMQIKNFDCKICSENFTKISLLKKHSMDSHNLWLE